MNTTDHETVRLLLGAYALNAVSPAERSQVERHLAECEACSHEARLLVETATQLAWLPPPEAAEDLIDRIAGSLPLRLRRTYVRLIAAVAAVAVAVAGFLGAALVRQRHQTDELGAIAASARRLRLVAHRGFEGEGTIYLARDRAALVLDRMPNPGRSRAYQLWAIAAGKPRSLAVVEASGRIVRIIPWHGEAEAFAITIEPAGGSPVPTSQPVLETQ